MIDYLIVLFWDFFGWKRQQRVYIHPNNDIVITMSFWYNANVRRGYLVDGEYPLINEESKLLDAGYELAKPKGRTGVKKR